MYMYVIVICLHTEHQGVHKNLSRDVHAFLDRVRTWKYKCKGETLARNSWENNNKNTTELTCAALFSWYAKYLYWNGAKMFFVVYNASYPMNKEKSCDQAKGLFTSR